MLRNHPNWEPLGAVVQEVAARQGGRLAVQVITPASWRLTGTAGEGTRQEGAVVLQEWGWHADEPCPAASVIKILVAWEAYRQAEAGTIALDEVVSIPREQVVGGTGVLHLLSPGTTLTWRDLVALMLAVSDNSATNLLIDRLGRDEINRTAQTLGLSATSLQRKMMDFAARAAGRDNFTSAADTARLLSFVALPSLQTQLAPPGAKAHRFLSPASCGSLLRILEQQQFNHKLPALLPGVRCAHKTGELAGIEHDAGVIHLPDGRPLVVAVFTWGLSVNADGVRSIAEVARAAYHFASAGCTTLMP